MPSSVVLFVLPKGKYKNQEMKIMKKKVLCTALAVTMLLTQTASDGGSFIRPKITKRYGESISLESYIPTKYGYTFK